MERVATLARRLGIQPGYVDGLRRRRRASREAVDAVAAIIGDDPPPAIDPVALAWDGDGGAVRIAPRAERASIEIVLEDGRRIARRVPVRDGLAALPDDLPLGYHTAHVSAGRASGDVLVLAAPRLAYQGDGERAWGVFLPLYAARSRRDWGAGNLSDLEELIRFVAGLGGDFVATLPILACFYDSPFDPSPYSPASRLFWNEFFLDVERVPELGASRTARALVASPAFRAEIRRLRSARLVDYEAGMALRRRALEACGRAIERSPARRAALEAFERNDPEVRGYAEFRARTEQTRRPWFDWPATPPAPDRARAAYHAYVQFLCAEQLDAVGRTAAGLGTGLYFDMPLGAHPAGYDVWRYREVFALGASAGAPPDLFFHGGQDWSFPPLVPGRVRSSGYAYPIACLRALLSRARVLRIDHVIGLHRMFWIPDGFSPADGVFVRWPVPEEWYAIIALESHRAGAIVAGEDLGTVPREVRVAMARHGILRSYVQQVEFDPRGAPKPVPARALAALNTHDMPTFRGFLRSAPRRQVAGLERELRREGHLGDGGDLLGAALARLAASPARAVLASIEDLLGQKGRQNRPATRARANWRRRTGTPLEGLTRVPRLLGRLERVAMNRDRSKR